MARFPTYKTGGTIKFQHDWGDAALSKAESETLAIVDESKRRAKAIREERARPDRTVDELLTHARNELHFQNEAIERIERVRAELLEFQPKTYAELKKKTELLAAAQYNLTGMNVVRMLELDEIVRLTELIHGNL